MRRNRTNTNKITANAAEFVEVEYAWIDKLLHPFVWLWVRAEEKCRNLRYRFQCFKKGYSDRDVWEMRDWFIRMAKPMLHQMSVKACNYPEEAGEEQWRRSYRKWQTRHQLMTLKK